MRRPKPSRSASRHPPSAKPARLIVVDDHPLIREGLAQLIEQEPGLEVCGSADNPHDAVALVDRLQPELAIVDLSLGESSGLELIKSLRARAPQLAILIVSIHDESFYAERALRAGARGYVMKQEATAVILTAIHRVLDGDVYVSERMAKRLLAASLQGRAPREQSPIERLSDRELEVLRLIGSGLGPRQIAERLYLSPKTIETYQAHLKVKLGMDHATELLQYAIQWVRSQQPPGPPA